MLEDERILSLEERVAELENEVEELKAAFNNVKSNQHLTMTTSKSAFNEKKKGWESIKKTQETNSKEKPDIEKLLTQVWLPRIFMVVMLLGVLWGFKVAVDYGFLTPLVRIILGFGVGAALIYFGQKQIRNNREKLGIVLLGGSYSILLFTTFAANTLFGYIPGPLAFMMNISWLVLGLFFAIKYQSQALGVFIAIGGYFIPFLIESTNPNIWIFALYETILYLVLLYFSLRKKFIVLYLVAFVLLHFTFFIYTVTAGFLSDNEPLVYGIIAQFLFVTVTYLKGNLYEREQMATLFTSFVFTSVWVNGILFEFSAELFALITTIVFLFISYYFKKDKERMVTASVVSAFALITWLIHVFDGDVIQVFLLLEGVALIYLGWQLQSKLQRFLGAMIYFVAYLIAIENNYLQLFSMDSVIWLTLLATVGFILFGLLKYDRNLKTLLWFVVGANVIAWLRFTYLLIPLLLVGIGENIIQMTVSFVWAILAVVLVVLGVKRNKKAVRLTGVALLFIALSKVVFIDLFMVSIAIRAILFIGLGVIGILISRIFYTKKD